MDACFLQQHTDACFLQQLMADLSYSNIWMWFMDHFTVKKKEREENWLILINFKMSLMLLFQSSAVFTCCWFQLGIRSLSCCLSLVIIAFSCCLQLVVRSFSFCFQLVIRSCLLRMDFSLSIAVLSYRSNEEKFHALFGLHSTDSIGEISSMYWKPTV